MMKMFLSAAATSMFVHVLLWFVARNVVETARGKWKSNARSLTTVAIGCAILGCGMAIAGACPGTVIVQAGAGVGGAWFVLLGGALGVMAFVQLEPLIIRMRKSGHANIVFLDELVHVSFPVLVSSIALALVAFVVLLEVLVPWRSELPAMSGAVSSFPDLLSARAWPPYAAGVVVGTLQIPCMLLLGKNIGSSSGYAWAIGRVLRRVAPSVVHNSPTLSSAVGATWQAMYLFGAVLGAAASSTLSGTRGAESHTLSPLVLVCGGFCLLLGARIAQGCTSGHGISGFSQLPLTSLVAVAAMFGSGIASALVLDSVGFF